MRLRPRWGLTLCLGLGVPCPAQAAPVDDKIELLRVRPTGMEEAQWRQRRREVARELGEVRSPKAVDALIEVVQTERYDAVLSTAINSLAKQGDPRAIDPLQRIYADRSLDTFVREDAATAIRELGGTPRDDARLIGEAERAPAGATDAPPPQLGTMGAQSVQSVDEEFAASVDKPLPGAVRAREREFAFVLGRLALDVDTRFTHQRVVADGGLGALARYVDERTRFGWTLRGDLDASVRNGDTTAVPSATGSDDGDVWLVRQGLSGVAEVHVYFGKSDFHAFAQVGLSERLTHVNVEALDDGNEDALTTTRFALDVVPAAGLGWGRYLNSGSDVLVDAVVAALRAENLLAKDIDATTRRDLQIAIYRRSNAFSAYPRLAAVVAILQRDGHLARALGVRAVHRLRSILEDPSYLDRPRGIRVRTGFLYDAPIAQSEFYRRNGDAVGAPYLQFDAGFQVDRERQIVADARFWYDVIAERGMTLSAGATYTRFLHTRYDDYRGQWFAGVRGGVSQRSYPDLADASVSPRLGYRGVGSTGYAYGFRRGSLISGALEAGVDSGGFVLGLGLGLRFGLAQGSVLTAATPSAPRTGPPGQ